MSLENKILSTEINEEDISELITDKNNYDLQIDFLKKEKKRLESVVDAAEIGTWEWEVKTGNLVVNEKWAAMVGYSLKELAPISVKTWEKLSHPEDLIKSNKMLEFVFNKKIPYYELEVRVKHKNGNWIWVLDRGRVTNWDSDGKPLLMIGSHIDISRLKDTRIKLAESTELYKVSKRILQSSLESLKDISIYSIDRNYCYLNFNEYHKIIMKDMYSQEIEIGRSILDYITTLDDLNRAKTNYDFALLGESHSITEEYGENQKAYFDITFGPIHNEENKIIGVTVFARDATEKIKQENALRYEKELAQKYLNLAGTIIIVLDQKGEVSLINQKGCNIIGMEEEDIIGKNWIENFIPKDIVSDVKKVFDNVFSEKIEMSKHHENTIITSNKEERIIAWDNNILYNSDGIITGIISSGEDVTEIRKKEVELCYLSYHDELTGLYNRRFFEEQIKRLDNPRNLPLSIVMGDVNGLKLTNDAFGHKAGDEILKMIGNIIATSIRGNDIATRWGGDEFVILLPSTGTDAAAMLINRIQEKIKNASFEYGIVSISFGVSAKKHRHDDINDIFTSAEELMYEKKLIDIDYIGGGAIDAIMNSLFKKSVKEKNHSTRVSELSVLIAENMGLSKAKINDIKIIGLIHDIGKIAIDLDILDKFGELTDEEKSIIQQHSLFGSKMLNSSHEYSRLALGVLHHHERIDGKGYPTGITGDQIPIESKIIAVTDSFDAMTAERPYRLNPFSLEEAISELRKHTGTQFDKTVVDIFINKVLSNHNTI